MKYLFSLFKIIQSKASISQISNTSIPNIEKASIYDMLIIQSKIQAALWGFFSGDALSAPTHWYYGGARQVQADYGVLNGYVKPKHTLLGSILNKSNTNGGGRGRFSKYNGISIIGDVINHGKWDLWDPRKSTQ